MTRYAPSEPDLDRGTDNPLHVEDAERLLRWEDFCTAVQAYLDTDGVDAVLAAVACVLKEQW